VGLDTKIIIGKYSGLFSLNTKLKSLGYNFEENQLKELLEIVRNKSISLKRSLFDSEIIETCETYVKSN
jgi:homocitrate synthase NifV